MIPICLILFILFIAVITFAIKRADSAQAKVTEEFWEKERKATQPSAEIPLTCVILPYRKSFFH